MYTAVIQIGRLMIATYGKDDYTMPSLTPPFSLRIPENLLNKVRFVADKNKRSTNKEIEFIIEQYIEDYEKKHGEIKVEE